MSLCTTSQREAQLVALGLAANPLSNPLPKDIVYSANPGDLVVVKIIGPATMPFVGEVIAAKPLVVKVEEHGSYSALKQGEVLVLERETAQLQQDFQQKSNVFLEQLHRDGRNLISGLRRLGSTDGKLFFVESLDSARDSAVGGL